MDMWQHATVSGAVSAGIYYFTKDVKAAAAFSLTGVFIDLDHFADYWREKGFNLDIPRFFHHFTTPHQDKLLIFMHAWELIVLAAVVTACLGFPSWGVAGTAGWLLHMVLDQHFNRFRPFGYSFIYRVKVGFVAKKIFYRD
jgi:hypothetical protein